MVIVKKPEMDKKNQGNEKKKIAEDHWRPEINHQRFHSFHIFVFFAVGRCNLSLGISVVQKKKTFQIFPAQKCRWRFHWEEDFLDRFLDDFFDFFFFLDRSRLESDESLLVDAWRFLRLFLRRDLPSSESELLLSLSELLLELLLLVVLLDQERFRFFFSFTNLFKKY